jgi:hypothetical protein
MGGSSSALATHAPQWITLKMVSTDLATTRLTRTTLAFRTTVLAIRVSPLHAEVPAALPLHAEVSAALAAADIATHATQARPPRLVAMHAEVLAAAATMETPARRQLLVEAPPAGSMPTLTATMKVVALGRKRISPLKKLSASAK